MCDDDDICEGGILLDRLGQEREGIKNSFVLTWEGSYFG